MKKSKTAGPELFEAKTSEKPKVTEFLPRDNQAAKECAKGISLCLMAASSNLTAAVRRCDEGVASKTLTDGQCERLLAISAECSEVIKTLTGLQKEADGMKDAIHGMKTPVEDGLI
jgi:hypothetical protein